MTEKRLTLNSEKEKLLQMYFKITLNKIVQRMNCIKKRLLTIILLELI